MAAVEHEYPVQRAQLVIVRSCGTLVVKLLLAKWLQITSLGHMLFFLSMTSQTYR